MKCGHYPICENVTNKPRDWIMISYDESESPSYFCSEECMKSEIIGKTLWEIKQEAIEELKAQQEAKEEEKVAEKEMRRQHISPSDYKEMMESALEFEAEVAKVAGATYKPGELMKEVLDQMVEQYDKFLEETTSYEYIPGQDQDCESPSYPFVVKRASYP